MIAAPHNLEAEQAVLGAVLFDNDALRFCAGLRGEHFYDPVHGRLWEMIVGEIKAGRLADGQTLRARLVADGGLKEIGGAAYILTLLENAARHSMHLREYGALIEEHWARRAVARIADEMRAAALASLNPAAEIVHEAEMALRRLELSAVNAATLRAAAEHVAATIDDDERALATGILTLDRRLGGLHPGDYILIGGRPSMGKTTIATNIARAVAWRGRKVHFASLEMSRDQIAGRALSAMSFEGDHRFAYAALRTGAAGIDRQVLAQMAHKLPDTMIIDETGAQSLAHLDAAIRETRRRLKGLDLVVVDYLGLMRATSKEGRVHQISEISAGLKEIAKRWSAPLIALSQLSRGPEGREDKRPTLADLRDSGSLEQDADAVIFVYREAYYLERNEPKRENFGTADDYEIAWRRWEDKRRACMRSVELITAKQRHGPIGTDVLEFWAEYDVAVDREAPRRQQS